MAWRLIAAAVTACCLATVADCPAQQTAEPSVRYVPLDAPAGMSRAVVVDGLPLVYTRQLLPLDEQGELVGADSADAQIEQVLDNLEAVLDAAGSEFDKLVRLNIHALSHDVAARTLELLSKRLDPAARPAITTVLTPLPQRKAVVAVDAIAVAAEDGDAVALARCDAVAGDNDCADTAVLPPGGVVYLSGQPEKGALAMSAVTKSLTTLLARLEQLKLSPGDVVQLKVFLTPASSAEAALDEVKRLFPDQLTPPVVFVEWIASAPVEIELVARSPEADEPAEPVELYDPPDVKPSPAFSRAALVRTAKQIFISGLSSRDPGDGEAQAADIFAQLEAILAETGSDMLHLAKATYYVSKDEASKALDKARLEFYPPQHAPAASKVTVHGVGAPKRTLTVDMIAVGCEE